jgi:hypothetical protein
MNRLYFTISSLREKCLYFETAIAKLQHKKERKEERERKGSRALQHSDTTASERPVPPQQQPNGDLLKFLVIDDYPPFTSFEEKPDLTTPFQSDQTGKSDARYDRFFLVLLRNYNY